MAQARNIRKQATLNKTRVELDALEAEGLVSSGHAFAPVLFVKGELSEDERAGEALLSGEDGNALRASLLALGYAPEDWACIATVISSGETLTAQQFRRAVATLDPSTLVCLDEGAAQLARDAYAEELASLADFDAAMLGPGATATVLGMRVLALGGFQASLQDEKAKQIMWSRLKTIPPLGEPF